MADNVGVHRAHCCKWHGCKYGDEDCPVVNGEVEQNYLCYECGRTLEDEQYHKRMLRDIEEIKKWEKEHKQNKGE